MAKHPLKFDPVYDKSGDGVLAGQTHKGKNISIVGRRWGQGTDLLREERDGEHCDSVVFGESWLGVWP